MRFLRSVLVAWLGVLAALVTGALVVRRVVPSFGDESSDEFSIVSTMGGTTFASTADAVTGGRVCVFLGGVELDLSAAEIVDGATIVLHAVLGGIDVIVPSTWRVEVVTSSLIGGIGNLTDPDGRPDDAPLLLVDATAVLGGIEIHAAEAA